MTTYQIEREEKLGIKDRSGSAFVHDELQVESE